MLLIEVQVSRNPNKIHKQQNNNPIIQYTIIMNKRYLVIVLAIALVFPVLASLIAQRSF